jgi:hypothetical protein
MALLQNRFLGPLAPVRMPILDPSPCFVGRPTRRSRHGHATSDADSPTASEQAQ